MNRVFSLFFLFLFSINVFSEAGAISNLAAIEAQERQQIIAELTWQLDAKQNCNAELNWNDAGSGADKDGFFFLPKTQGSEYIIGGYVSDKLRSDYHCVITVREVSDNPEGTPQLLAKPADWKMIWKDSGSGAHADGSIWQAIPPDSNYVCIGNVSRVGYDKPNIPAYRCVHSTLTEKINAKLLSWTDKGSGAKSPVSVFRLPQTISFVAIPERVANAPAFDLVKDAKRVPNPEQVEKILAQRMAPLKADIETKLKQKQEQQSAEKRLAEEAKKEARQKAMAEKLAVEEAKQKQIAEEKAAEEKQLSKDAEKLAMKTEVKEPVKTETAVEEVVVKEEVVKVEPVQAEPSIIDDEPVVEKETASPEPEVSKSAAKGLDLLVNTFLKILAILFVGLIVLLFAFKFIFGSKKEK